MLDPAKNQLMDPTDATDPTKIITVYILECFGRQLNQALNKDPKTNQKVLVWNFTGLGFVAAAHLRKYLPVNQVKTSIRFESQVSKPLP